MHLPKGSGKALNCFDSGEVYTHVHLGELLLAGRYSKIGGGQHLSLEDPLGGSFGHQC